MILNIHLQYHKNVFKYPNLSIFERQMIAFTPKNQPYMFLNTYVHSYLSFQQLQFMQTEFKSQYF